MTTFTSPVSAGSVVVSADPLRLAVSAYLARFKGISREHTCSDLHAFVTWCTERGVEPLAAQRTDLELFVRWMQETRPFKPSTVARRTSVLAGFYRTCVIDGVLDHSPAEYVRRPTVPPESPTLGLTHLQFEAMLTAARESSNVYDFALWRCWACLGCGSSKPPARTSPTWVRNTGTASCGSWARAPRWCWCRCHRRWRGRSTGRSAHGLLGRSW